MTITLRRPTLAEAEAMAGVHMQCWREAYSAIMPTEMLAKTSLEGRVEMWRKSLGNDRRIAFAAYDDHEAVGFIMAGTPIEMLCEGMDGQLMAIYILASHQRQGLGGKLIGLAARAWLEQGGASLTLAVLAENAKARRFYETHGARLITTQSRDGFGLADAIYVFENLSALSAYA